MTEQYHLLLSAKIGLLNNTDHKVYTLSQMRTAMTDREYDELIVNIRTRDLPVESLQYASLELVELRRNIYCNDEIFLSAIVECDPARICDMFLFYLDGFTVTAVDGYLSGDDSVVYRDGFTPAEQALMAPKEPLTEFQLVLDDIRAVVYHKETMEMIKGMKVMGYWVDSEE